MVSRQHQQTNRKGYRSPCCPDNRMDDDTSGAVEGEGRPDSPPDQHGPMLWIAITLLGILLFLVIFANIPDMRASAGTVMIQQQWELRSYVNGTGVMVPALPDAAVILQFPKAGIAGGRSGCSYYSVNYTTRDYSIAITDLVIAGLACWDPKATEQEEAYFVDLTNCTEFRVSETSLKMFGKDGRELLVFIPAT